MNPKKMLQSASLFAVKALGQHFLTSDSRIKSIVDSLDLREGLTVVEIGPGLGALTDVLIERRVRVIAVEKDPKLASILEARYKNVSERARVINRDFLEYTFEDVRNGEKCVVFGNLPYYISSPILFHLVEFRKKISSAVLTLQREVAQRLVAQPNSKEYGRLTLSFGLFAEVKHLFDIRKNEFYPQPRVGSSTVLIHFKENVHLPAGVSEDMYSKVVKRAFGTRRKQISNALLSKDDDGWSRDRIETALSHAGIDARVRAENLSLDLFLALCAELVKVGLK